MNPEQVGTGHPQLYLCPEVLKAPSLPYVSGMIFNQVHNVKDLE